MQLKTDLEHILQHTAQIWPAFKNARIFITGGTGFIGKWLLESFIAANEYFSLNAKAIILTRESNNFRKAFPHLGNDNAIFLHDGDVRNFQFPKGDFTHVIHGATDVANVATWLDTYQVIVDGTKRVLEFSRERNIRDILLISSGAVYGRQPPEIQYLEENYTGSPALSMPQTAYGQGKRIAEWLAGVYNAEYGLECRIARCFAFIGPYLPLKGSFALGNFMTDMLQNETIKIKGDGRTVRSYLYASDMAIWLWTILIRGRPNISYNVGSEAEINIHELATKLASFKSPALNIKVLTPKNSTELPERYVPSTKLVQKELGLALKVPIHDALSRMVNWMYNNACSL